MQAATKRHSRKRCCGTCAADFISVSRSALGVGVTYFRKRICCGDFSVMINKALLLCKEPECSVNAIFAALERSPLLLSLLRERSRPAFCLKQNWKNDRCLLVGLQNTMKVSNNTRKLARFVALDKKKTWKVARFKQVLNI